MIGGSLSNGTVKYVFALYKIKVTFLLQVYGVFYYHIYLVPSHNIRPYGYNWLKIGGNTLNKIINQGKKLVLC